mmetsp:Transcript_13719/g.33781  ORF Transcript_13719/g.33781 Transcript_13719/m.33781 type:complete len:208 (-) Transcript_13719:346-969(-)
MGAGGDQQGARVFEIAEVAAADLLRVGGAFVHFHDRDAGAAELRDLRLRARGGADLQTAVSRGPHPRGAAEAEPGRHGGVALGRKSERGPHRVQQVSSGHVRRLCDAERSGRAGRGEHGQRGILRRPDREPAGGNRVRARHHEPGGAPRRGEPEVGLAISVPVGKIPRRGTGIGAVGEDRAAAGLCVAAAGPQRRRDAGGRTTFREE